MLPLRLSAGMPAADAAIQKTIYVSGTTALIISNEEMEHITNVVKSLEKSGLMKGINWAIKNEAKEQKGGFLSMLLGTLASILLGSALRGKRVRRPGKGTIWAAGKNC